MIAQEHSFWQPGELEKKYIPAFAQLFQRAKLAKHGLGMRRVHNDESPGHVRIVDSEAPGQYPTPVMSNDDGHRLSQSFDQPLDVAQEIRYIVAFAWFIRE